jgi:hypothetical protein
LRAKEIKEKEKEVKWDHWFNQDMPMKESGKTWKEKKIEREERGKSSGSDGDSQGKEAA